MRATSRVVAVSILASTVAHLPCEAQGASPTLDAPAAFALLKTLAGDWEATAEYVNTTTRPPRRVTPPVRLRYRVVANDSAVVETKYPSAGGEMITVFTMDGQDQLVMTHYCTLGNQPRMRFEAGGAGDTLRFVFAGGTNFDPQKDRHLHEGTIRVLGEGTLEHAFTTFKDGKKLDTTILLLRRTP